MKALITVGCMTDHGGIISTGDSSYLVEGKAVHLDGMTHFCPKCKVQARAIASNQGFMMVGGKSIVAVGDQATCGAKYLKISDLAVMSSGGGSGSARAALQLFNNTISLQESFVSKQSLAQNSDKAYYKWWWGELESNNPKTIAQEKNSFLQNFSDLHDEYAFGKVYKVYEIDPKAWDGEVAFDGVFPNGIQQSVDSSGDLGKALAKLADGQSSNITWKNIGVGGDYFKTIRSKQWPHGRWACTVIGTLTRFGKDANGRHDFQFKGYAKIEKDYYSWEEDNKGVKNKGIKLLGDAIEMAAGTKTASPIYSNSKPYGLPTICMRKYHFDYYKKGVKKPNY